MKQNSFVNCCFYIAFGLKKHILANKNNNNNIT